MNKIILIATILFIVFKGYSQKVHFNANIGYGTYALKDIKNFQDEMISSTTVNDKSVERFPAYLYYNFSTDYAFNKFHYGGFGITYYSSGGRNHVADYSGEYSLDMIANAYSFDIHYKVTIISYKKFSAFFQYKTGLLYTKLDISENMSINNSIIIDKTNKYSGYSIVSEPSIQLSYAIFKSLYLNFSAGFEKCSKLRILSDKGFESEGDNQFDYFDDDISADWSGIRTTIGISYAIGKND